MKIVLGDHPFERVKQEGGGQTGVSYRTVGSHCYYIIKSRLAISSPDEFFVLVCIATLRSIIYFYSAFPLYICCALNFNIVAWCDLYVKNRTTNNKYSGWNITVRHCVRDILTNLYVTSWMVRLRASTVDSSVSTSLCVILQNVSLY